MASSKSRIKASGFRPLKSNVFVTDLDSGPVRTASGIIIPDDNMTERGIHPRWAKVHAVGPDVGDLDVGEYVLVAHGRWTTGIDIELGGQSVRMWRVDYPEGILVTSQTDPRAAVTHRF